jgi:ketosteroid isomerase-like protein
LQRFVAQFDQAFAREDADVASKGAEQQNIECLKRFFSALARGEFEAAFVLMTDDAEYSMYAGGAIPFQMSGRGRVAVQTGVRNNYSAIAFDDVEIDSLIAQGDVVVVIARQRGRWRASQVEFDERILLRYGFRDGRLCSYRGWILPTAP